MKLICIRNIVLFAGFFLLAGASSLQAGNDTWVGNTSANWADSNWTGANNPPLAGDALFFGVAGTAGTTLSDNLGVGFSLAGITFNPGAAAFTLNASGGSTIATSAGTVDNAVNTETINIPVLWSANHSLSVTSGGTLIQDGSISGGNYNLTKTGLGTLILGADDTGLGTGTTTINGGTLELDFTQPSAPSANIVSSTSPLGLGGGTLLINGNASSASSQTFASTAFNSGANVISAAPASGANYPTVALGAFTYAASSVQFVGPATIGSGGGNVAATATITTTSAGTGALGLIESGAGTAYATVGLYDWASTDTTGGSAGTTINGGSQVSGFYTTLSGTIAANNAMNLDVTGTSGNSNGTTDKGDTLRFNTAAAITFTVAPAKNFQCLGILVTPNVGANNVTFVNAASSGDGLNHNYVNPLSIFQNNTMGELLFSANNWYGILGSGSYIQSGPGTVFLDGTAGNDYIGPTYLNGGVTEIGPNINGGVGGPSGQLGIGTGANLNVNLNGGTLIGDYTGNLDGTNLTARPVVLGNNGGGLGAVSNFTMTVDGVVSDVTGAGPLVVGIPASSANGSTIGQLPGTGTGTANASVFATGTLILNNTGNTYTGGTVLDSGILQMSGSSLAVFGTGGITLNGGTFQWPSANTTDISGRTITLASGGGTLDVNGNTVALANSIGNGGSGTLTVFSSAANGVLNLSGANTYTGGMRVTNVMLEVNNTTGSATGSGAVTLNNGGILGGNGTISGSVTINSGGGLAPGNGGVGTNTVGSLTLNSGAINNFKFNGTANDQTVVSTSGGLVINGGVFNLYQPGGTTPYTTPGTYKLIQYSGSIGGTGISALSVGNPQTGFTYTFGASGGFVTVQIGVSASVNIGTWGVDANGNWSVAGNWTATAGTMPPRNAGDSATLGTGSALRVVTLDANETVGSLTLNNNNSFVIASGGNTLTLDNKGGGASVTVTGGTANGIQTAVALNDNSTVTVSAGKSLAISGAVGNSSTAETLTVNGPGTLALSGNNSYGPSASSGFGTTLSGSGILQVGNNNSLGAGDVSIPNGGTLQAGASVSLLNNFDIASGTTATVDNNGNNLTLGGNITDSGALTKIGNGTLTLNGNNTYSGNTTVNAGVLKISSSANVANTPAIILNGGDLLGNGNITLGSGTSIGIGATSGTVATNALIDAASGDTFELDGVIASAGNTGTNNLTVNSGAGNNGIVILGGANTFKGSTVISNGTLRLGNSAALQNSTLNYNSGTLDFGSLTAATLGGLSGTQPSQILNLMNDSPAAVTLTVGGNGASTTYYGNLSGSGSLTKAGAGTLTLSNANYTGNTTVNAGVVSVTGGSFGSSTSILAQNDNGNGFQISGGTVTAQTFNLGIVGGNQGSSATISGTGSAAFGTVTIGNSGNTAGSLTINSSGTISLGNVTVVRENGGTGNGVIINGGTVTATSVKLSENAHGADLNIAGGNLTIGNSSSTGAFEDGTSGSANSVTVSSGTLTYLGTDGLLASTASGVGSSISISGGIATLTGITLDQFGTSGDTCTLTVSGGALYLGSVGLVEDDPAPNPNVIFLGAATVGALADWTSSAPITLTNNPNFKAADALNVPHNITLNGVLSGTSGLTKTGNGILTLGGANTYTGGTTVSNGVLMVNGNTAGSGVDVLTNATLGGSGTIGDPTVTIENGGHTLPGGILGNTAGTTTTISHNLTYNAGAEADFNASTVYNSGNGEIVVNGTLTGNNINVGVNFTGGAGANMDTSGFYTLFQLNGAHPATFNSAPIWLGTPPANSNLFSVITLGNSVVLSGSPIKVASATATPNPAGHGQTVTFAVNVTAGSYTINPNTGISLDASPLGGSSTLYLVQSNGTSVYTNSIVLSNPAFGQYTFNYTVTDSNGDTITPTISFTVGGAPEVWNGNAEPDNTWGNGLNWVSGSAPLTGDLVTFAGTHQLMPNMETSYSIGSLTFDNTAGSFNITNDGSGTLTLSGNATNNSANVETLSVPVYLTGEPTFNTAAGNIVISNAVSDDNNGFIKAGTNTLILEGDNTYSGATSISNGTLVVGGAGQLGSGSYAANIADNGTLTYNSSSAQTLSGIISGSGALNQNGSSTLTLSGANTFSNTTTINAGTLTLANSLALQNSTLNYNSGSLIFSGITAATLGGLSGTVNLSLVNDGFTAVALTVGGNNSTTVYSGNISDSGASSGKGSLTKNGTGTLTLSGNISNTGTNTVNTGGTLVLSGNNSGRPSAATNDMVVTGTLQLQANGGNTVSGTSTALSSEVTAGTPLTLNVGGTIQLRSDGNVTFAGANNLGGVGNGAITFDVNQLTSAGTNNTFTLAPGGFNIFNTTINVTGGSGDTLALGSITDVGGAQSDVFNPTTGNLTINGINGSSGANVLNLSGTSTGNSIVGVIANGSGTLSVIKTNTSTWTLSAANTYTGATTISNGTLLVNGSIASAVSVNGGVLGGTGTIGGAVTVSATGTLAPGTSAIGTLTVNNSLTLGGNVLVKLNKSLSPAQSNDMVNVTGTLTYGGTLTVTNIGSALSAGDSFNIFPASGSGTVTVSGNAGNGLAFSFNPASGVLSVVSVAAPLSGLKFTAKPVISGTSLTISATNSGAGTVYLLTSTNVAAHLNTWTPVWTNILGGSGSFTTNLSNVVTPGSKQQFYTLSNTNN